MQTHTTHIQSIIRTYLDHLSELSPKKQRHFLYRLYQATKDPTQLALLKKTSTEYTQEALGFVTIFNDPAQSLSEQLHKIAHQRQEYLEQLSRNPVWGKNPELVIFYSFLVDTFYLKFFDLPFELHTQRVAELMKMLVENEEFMHQAPVPAICIPFYLSYIGQLPVEYNLEELGRKMVALHDPQASDPAQLNRYLYAVTHIIVCSSDYYQHPPLAAFAPYLEELKSQVLGHFSELKLDLIAEAGVCDALYQDQDEAFRQKVLDQMDVYWDEPAGVVRSPQSSSFSLEEVEHLHALFILTYYLGRPA